MAEKVACEGASGWCSICVNRSSSVTPAIIHVVSNGVKIKTVEEGHAGVCDLVLPQEESSLMLK